MHVRCQFWLQVDVKRFWCLQYEPELFPGLIYRMKQPKVVLLIFVSGKVVLTGELQHTLSTTRTVCKGRTVPSGKGACGARVCMVHQRCDVSHI